MMIRRQAGNARIQFYRIIYSLDSICQMFDQALIELVQSIGHDGSVNITVGKILPEGEVDAASNIALHAVREVRRSGPLAMQLRLLHDLLRPRLRARVRTRLWAGLLMAQARRR